MNDSIPVADDLAPQLSALREARQRAAEARANAERLLREAQAAEAELAAQEEEAIAAALIEREREALDALTRLHAQIQQAAAKKAQAEAAVAAIRASLAEHEEQLRNAEIHERELLSDLSIAERRAHDAARARETLQGISAPPPAPEPVPPAPPPPAPAPAPEPALAGADSVRAQRAAERRLADAMRAASG
jgi:DNA repair exonuclease SbcCD ATPase subunit